MKVRKYQPQDFDIVYEWFKKRGWPNLSDILPPNGWICEDDKGPIACCWIYLSDAPVGFLEWSVTRPDEMPLKSLKGLKMCIEGVKQFARDIGLKSVLQFIPDERLVKYYESQCGFKTTEKATLMVWNQ